MSIGLLHKLYGFGVSAALPFIAVGLLLTKRGRRRIAERFGAWAAVDRVDWWLHGASVGEVQGLLPLIAAIRKSCPNDRILLTATSPTGLDRALPHVDAVRLLPLDAPLCVRRALAHVRFERLVISETELWPTLLREIQLVGRSVHIINGRVSDYTFRWYRLCNRFFAPLLEQCVSISVPDQEQRERFRALGTAPNLLHVTGHTKYDTPPRFVAANDREQARQKFFPGIDNQTPLVVLGSLREGEELAWFAALQRAWAAGIKLRVLVAPRHAERFEFFWGALVRLNRKVARWTSGGVVHGAADEVLLLDTMGLLEQAYVASDLAFVGATLVDIGGHNPLEPAMYRVPVVVGPYTSVIRSTVSRMREHGGIIEVHDADGIYEILRRLAAADPTLREIAQAGHLTYASYAGAVQRVLDTIRSSEVKIGAPQSAEADHNSCKVTTHRF